MRLGGRDGGERREEESEGRDGSGVDWRAEPKESGRTLCEVSGLVRCLLGRWKKLVIEG